MTHIPRWLLIVIALTVLLSVTGCSGAGEVLPDRTDPLFRAAHHDIDLSTLQYESAFFKPWMLAMIIGFLGAMISLYWSFKTTGKWIGVMIVIGFWFTFGYIWMESISNSWPPEFTETYLEESVGPGDGLVPDGDVNPVTAPIRDMSITSILRQLKDQHYFVGIFWLILPLPIAVINLTGISNRFTGGVIGMWFAFYYTRKMLPSMLFDVVEEIHEKRTDPGSIPFVGDITAAVDNTLFNHLNLDFITGWWGRMFLMYALTILLIVSIGVIAAPYVGELVVRIKGDDKKDGKDGSSDQKGRKPKGPKDDPDGKSKARSTKRTDRTRVDKKTKEGEKELANQNKRRQQSRTKGDPKKDKANQPIVIDSVPSKKKSDQKPEPKTEKDWKQRLAEAFTRGKQGLVRSLKGQARVAQIAGEVMVVAGQPEGAILIGAGKAQEQLAIALDSPDQDPVIAVDRHKAEQALKALKQHRGEKVRIIIPQDPVERVYFLQYLSAGQEADIASKVAIREARDARTRGWGEQEVIVHINQLREVSRQPAIVRYSDLQDPHQAIDVQIADQSLKQLEEGGSS